MTVAVCNGCVKMSDGFENWVVEVNEVWVTEVDEEHKFWVNRISSQPECVRGKILSCNSQLRDADKHRCDARKSTFNGWPSVVDNQH